MTNADLRERVTALMPRVWGELAELVAAKYPEVTFLPRGEELAGDTVPKEAVYQDCLVRMEAKNQKRYDCLIDLDITSPLRQAFDLVRAMQMFEAEPGLDLVMSAAPSRRMTRKFSGPTVST